jgi:hypothetical protein
MTNAVPTTDQLRNDIDLGATGEKIAHPDPAAAPLGTDDEAAGQTPTRAERAMESRSRPVHSERSPRNGILTYVILVALVSVLIIGAVFLGRTAI